MLKGGLVLSYVKYICTIMTLWPMEKTKPAPSENYPETVTVPCFIVTWFYGNEMSK